MYFSQCLMVFETVRKNPGLTCLGISVKLEEDYGKDEPYVKLMRIEDTSENSFLMSIIKDIYCIERKEDKFYFNKNIEPPKTKDIVKIGLQNYISKLAKTS